jgi:hypothetical protein
MNNSSVKYLQGINILQITFAENTKIKNLGRETPDSYSVVIILFTNLCQNLINLGGKI